MYRNKCLVMRERHKTNVVNWRNNVYHPIDIVSERSERSGPNEGLNCNSNGMGHRSKLNDVSVQPKFERTYRFTRRKSVVREISPKIIRSESKRMNYELKSNNYDNFKNYNAEPKTNYIDVLDTRLKDTGGINGNELKNSLVVNIPDQMNHGNQLIPSVYQQYQLPPHMQQMLPADNMYKTLDSRMSNAIDRNNVDRNCAENGNGCMTAIGDLYNGLESLGMALCKIISVTGQSCLKACQLIEHYAVDNTSENKFNKKFAKIKMGNYDISNIETPSINNYYSSSEKSRPMTLDERKKTRDAIEKYLSGDKINLRCNFEVNLDEQLNSTGKTYITDKTRLTGKSGITNGTDKDILSRLESYKKLHSINMRSPNINNTATNDSIEINRNRNNTPTVFRNGNLNIDDMAMIPQTSFALERKIMPENDLVLNNPLNTKQTALPPFRKLSRKDSSTKRLVDQVEIVELSKLNGDSGNIMPKYMESDKSSNSMSVKTLDQLDNNLNECKSEQIDAIGISKIDHEVGNDEKKNKAKGSGKLKAHKGHRC